MKRFLPLILSALITAALAGVWAWRQQDRIAGLREKIAARAAAPPAAADAPEGTAKPGAASPAAAPADFLSVLARTKSRSVLRIAQELMQHYQTCPVEELRAALEARNGSFRFTSIETAGAFTIAMSALAQRDIAAAVECVGKLRGETVLPAALILLNDWSLRDKKAAVEWFHSLNDQKLKGALLSGATLFYSGSQPQIVEELRNSISDEGVRDKAASEAMHFLAAVDPEAALGNVSELAEPDQRRAAERTALLSLAKKDPQKALGMMLLNAAPEDRKATDADAARVLLHFTSVDKQAADQWMAAQNPALIQRLFTAEPSLGTAASKSR
jgi:hypothetical protein